MRRWTVVLGVLSLALLAGCQSQKEWVQTKRYFKHLKPVKVLKSSTVLESHSDSWFVRASEGGTFTLDFNEEGVHFEYTLTIYPNTLPQNMTVTMTVPDPTQVEVYLDPAGTELYDEYHMHVYISRSPFNSDSATMAVWNDVVQAWEEVDGNVTITDTYIEADGDYIELNKVIVGEIPEGIDE